MSVAGVQLLRRGTSSVAAAVAGLNVLNFKVVSISRKTSEAAPRFAFSPPQARPAQPTTRIRLMRASLPMRGSDFESVAAQGPGHGMADQIRPFLCVASHRCSNRSFDPE